MLQMGGVFHYEKGILCCQGLPLSRIAERFSTPTYVYSSQSITDQCRAIRQAFSRLDCEFFYAVKANANLAILERIARQGFAFDVVSGGELERLRQLGIPGDRILFSGVGKSRTELELAHSLQIRSINVESLQELRLLAEMSRQGAALRIGLRVNPQITVRTHPYVATGQAEHKFGISLHHFEEAIDLIASSNLELRSVGCHLGSQLRDPQPYLAALDRLLELRSRVEARGLALAALNLGGGFGISYRDGDDQLDLAELARLLADRQPGIRLLFEPGRRVVASAGALLTRVLYRKSTPGKNFVICDAAMNDLIRPALYGASHRILPLRQDAPLQVGDLVGPICETGDFLARETPLPCGSGEGLAILDVGAYGMTLSSNYNSRPRAAEVLVRRDEALLIRRRETFQDLIACELPERRPPEE